MSINGKLVHFAQNELAISQKGKQRKDVTATLEALKRGLRGNSDVAIKDFIHFGSYKRGTMLPSQYDAKADVDLMVIMNTQQREETPGVYRSQLKIFAQKQYADAVYKKDFPVVKLNLKKTTFELVPAIQRGQQYNIPGPNDTWLPTQPNDLETLLKKAQQENSNISYKNLIRLIKHWNATGSKRHFKSYELEKKILKLRFRKKANPYEAFLSALKQLAKDKGNTAQILQQIQKYKGTDREWQCLIQLLPGLK